MTDKETKRQGDKGRVYSFIKLILLTLAGGILMGMTPAPVEAWYLAWFALIPLWLALIKHKLTIKQMILLALAWSFGYHGLALSWITGIHPMTWMGVPWLASLAIALTCWLIITLWGALLVIIWALLWHFLTHKSNLSSINSHNSIQNPKSKIQNPLIISLSRIIIGVAIWCLLEYLWSLGPLWWTSLSYTQSPHNLVILHLGRLSGTSTITASIVFINGLLAESLYWLIFSQKQRQVSIYLINIALFSFISLHLLGFSLYQSKLNDNPNEALHIGIIQGNIPNEIKLYSDGWRKAIEGYTQGYLDLAKQVEVILTPETALPFFWENLQHNSSIYTAITQAKVPIWLGAFGQQGNSYTNSLFTITGEGKLFSRYNKYKLVPLGEYIPLVSVFGKLINRLSPLDAHLAPGVSKPVFDTPFGRAIVGICYESAFAEYFRQQTAQGGQFIITASNNAHYSPSMPAQHQAQDIMRAIESDRWLAKATNTGYSAIISPHGQTIWRSQLNQYTIHAGTIYHRYSQTLYVRWGDWLTPTLLVVAIIIVSGVGSRKSIQ